MADLDDWGIDPSLFRAMSHPLRVQILGDLSLPGAVWSPSDYSEEFCLPLNTVAYHFRELLKFGLIEIHKEEPVRGGVEHFYRARKSALFTNTPAWEKLPGLARTSVAAKAWGGYMSVGRRAIEASAFEKRPDANFSWGTMRVDEQGWAELQASLAQTLRHMFEIGAEAAKRIDDGAESFDATYGLGGFESPPVNADEEEEPEP